MSDKEQLERYFDVLLDDNNIPSYHLLIEDKDRYQDYRQLKEEFLNLIDKLSQLKLDESIGQAISFLLKLKDDELDNCLRSVAVHHLIYYDIKKIVELMLEYCELDKSLIEDVISDLTKILADNSREGLNGDLIPYAGNFVEIYKKIESHLMYLTSSIIAKDKKMIETLRAMKPEESRSGKLRTDKDKDKDQKLFKQKEIPSSNVDL